MYFVKFVCTNCGQWHEFSGTSLQDVDADLIQRSWEGSVFDHQFNAQGEHTGLCCKCSDALAEIDSKIVG
jgi:hypothetical protein